MSVTKKDIKILKARKNVDSATRGGVFDVGTSLHTASGNGSAKSGRVAFQSFASPLLCLSVCLSVLVSRSVLTTFGSGLLGPQDPFSTHVGDWDLLFII